MAVISVITCHAQTADIEEEYPDSDTLEKRVGFGIRAGGGYSNILHYRESAILQSYKPCVQLGFFTEIRIVKPLYIQVEALYSNPGYLLFTVDKKGYKVRDSSFVMDCIQLPVQIKLKVGKTVRGYFMTGVAPSLLLGARLKYKVDSTAAYDNYTYLENRLTLNVVNTIGLEATIEEWWVVPFIDFRYLQGLTSVHKRSPVYNNDLTFLNVQFLLSIGVRF